MPEFLCQLCSAPAFTIRPGQDAEYVKIGPLFPPVLVRPPVPDVVLCLACAPKTTKDHPK